MESPPEPRPASNGTALRIALWTVIVGGAALVALVSILGAFQMAQAPISDEKGALPVGRFAAFALDTETNAATAFASLLTLGAAILAGVLAALRTPGVPRWALILIALVLGYMAADEWFAIHERAPILFGISRRLWFLPLAILAFVGWLYVLRGLGRYAPARAIWLGAAAVWVCPRSSPSWRGRTAVRCGRSTGRSRPSRRRSRWPGRCSSA